MFRSTRVQVDLSALKSNLQLLKNWNGSDFFCPMVKANAYGHGAVYVAQAVSEVGVDAMGVALVEEGLELRMAGIETPILVFAPFDLAAASAMLTHQLTPVVSRFEDLEALASLKTKTPLDIHIKFNTGMNRQGFDESDLPRLRQALQNSAQINIKGLCTHLTHGEDVCSESDISEKQLQKLKSMSQGFSGCMHAHKSASLSTYAKHGRLKPPGIGARPGIAMYGLPHEGRDVGPGLKPVLRWFTHLTHIHYVNVGDGVSYGSRWRASRRSVIGVVPIGYGDGYSRALSGKAPMLFRGKRVKNVGMVCMDYIMVDLTDAVQNGPPRAGEEIVLIGRQGGDEISAGELAVIAGTISYEIVTAIRSRVARELC